MTKASLTRVETPEITLNSSLMGSQAAYYPGMINRVTHLRSSTPAN